MDFTARASLRHQEFRSSPLLVRREGADRLFVERNRFHGLADFRAVFRNLSAKRLGLLPLGRKDRPDLLPLLLRQAKHLGCSLEAPPRAGSHEEFPGGFLSREPSGVPPSHAVLPPVPPVGNRREPPARLAARSGHVVPAGRRERDPIPSAFSRAGVDRLLGRTVSATSPPGTAESQGQRREQHQDRRDSRRFSHRCAHLRHLDLLSRLRHPNRRHDRVNPENVEEMRKK